MPSSRAIIASPCTVASCARPAASARHDPARAYGAWQMSRLSSFLVKKDPDVDDDSDHNESDEEAMLIDLLKESAAAVHA